MSVPSPWIALLLLAASFRIWRILADDDIFERPRRWVVRLPRDWEEGQMLPEGYRIGLAAFITCPWCLGFWVTIAVWLAWQASPHWTEVLSVPLALSAGVGIIRKNLDGD